MSFHRALSQYPAANVLGFLVSLAIYASAIAIAEEPSSPQQASIHAPDFATEVLPLLSDRCAACHGPDEESRAAELRLDVADAIGAESQNGGLPLIIKAGDASASEMIRRIRSDDPSEKMPPPESNLKLSAAEIETLERWINSGADWDQLWSLRPIEQPPLPDDPRWQHDAPIDRLIHDRLANLGIEPTAEDDRYALIRRLTLDLTGLPPTDDEIDQFINDNHPAAYERLVDRLLARPEYGQQMAVPWLDASRYADTYGYQSDVYRDVWPWRDWVIDAFNAAMPYDQFITWQLAGDLLPEPTRESRLATAFNRLHRQTNEGGSVEEEFRAEYIADRVNTLGTAVLGLTLECARCHDHKYDPISQEDYYRLSAFFTNIDESGLYSHFTNYVPTPVLDLPTPAQQQALTQAQQAVAQAEDSYRQALEQAINRANINAATSAPATTGLLVNELAHYRFTTDGQTLDASNAIANGAAGKWQGQLAVVPRAGDQGGAKFSGEDGFATAIGGDWDWWQPFSIGLWLKPAEAYERAVVWHRSKAWTDAASCGYELLIEEGKLSAALIHFWPGDAIRVRSVAPLAVDRWSHVTVTWDGSGKAAGLQLFVDGQPIETEVVRDKLVRTIRGGGANELTLGNRFRDRGFKNGQMDDLRIFDRDLSPLEVNMLVTNDAPESNDQLRAAQAFASDEEVVQARSQLRQARSEFAAAQDAIAAIMTMEEEPGLHETFILHRGEYNAPGEKIDNPLVPEAISPWPSDAALNRLGLARWLTASDAGSRHPLVARVIANRTWQMFFDQGLVTTPEDFGLQGQPPTYPELLDYLAAQLIEQQWDLKLLTREIVTSQAYRRSDRVTEATRAKDPENRLLARGPSARLTFETIRDAALASAGLLDRTFGGPPVRPYQPPGLWEEKSGAAYSRQQGAGSHRRSLYTIWKRTSPPPSMILFDAPGREVCVAGRTVTQTPLQALVLLNDEQFVEAARGIAFQILIESNGDQQENIRRLYHRMMGRPASDREQSILHDLVQQQTELLKNDPESRNQFLKIGDFDYTQTRYVDQIDATQLAALSIAAQTLMNLDHWVSR